MQLLNKAAKFTTKIQDLKKIYISYVRSILEQSSVVWHSSLTLKNKNDLERVQKVAVRIILGNHYINYKDGLSTLKIQNLFKRREEICLNFAKKCLKNEKLKNIFPKKLKSHKMTQRKTNTFKIKKTNKKRYQQSAIPYMTKLLNKYYSEKSELIKIT